MRTSDKGLLQKMGFHDADRNTSRHTLACQYLASDEGIGWLIQQKLHPGDCDYYELESYLGLIEYPLYKKGTHCTTGCSGLIGFADVFITDTHPARMVRKISYGDTEYCTQEPRILIEVKAMQCNVTEIIKQLLVYQGMSDVFAQNKKWEGEEHLVVAFSDWMPSKLDVNSLVKHGIRPIYLGEHFEDWVDSQRGNTEAML